MINIMIIFKICSRMDSDSDDQLLEDDEFPDIGMELSFANRVPPKPGIRDRDHHEI